MFFKDLRLPFDFIFFWFYIWCKFSDLYFFLTFPGFQVPLSKVLNPTMYELVTRFGCTLLLPICSWVMLQHHLYESKWDKAV